MSKPKSKKSEQETSLPVKPKFDVRNRKTWSEEQKETVDHMKAMLGGFGPVAFVKGKDDTIVEAKEKDSLLLTFQLMETTGIPDPHTASTILGQIYRAQPKADASWNETAALLHALSPNNALEGLLASQMIAVHNMAMEFSRRAMVKDQSTEAVERNINRLTKLIRTFTTQTETLNRLRQKGQQTIQVQHQHIQVGQGGQAVIGNIAGGGENAKTD